MAKDKRSEFLRSVCEMLMVMIRNAIPEAGRITLTVDCPDGTYDFDIPCESEGK